MRGRAAEYEKPESQKHFCRYAFDLYCAFAKRLRRGRGIGVVDGGHAHALVPGTGHEDRVLRDEPVGVHVGDIVRAHHHVHAERVQALQRAGAQALWRHTEFPIRSFISSSDFVNVLSPRGLLSRCPPLSSRSERSESRDLKDLRRIAGLIVHLACLIMH